MAPLRRQSRPEFNRTSPRRSPAAARSSQSLPCELAARIAAAHYELPFAEVIAVPRGRREMCRARHVAIYLAHVSLGVPMSIVASDFHRDRSTVGYACRIVEEARDRPAFDAALATLELTARVMLESGCAETLE
jgi:chromosomal replication initiation ATPase DnaA